MIFTETKLKGAYVIDIDRKEDPRGFFARVYCRKTFEEKGLDPSLAQANISGNLKKGTLRGLHFQRAPHAEIKIVRCTRGRIFDVMVDLRKNSPTHKQWVGEELNEENHRMLYIPKGFAHGYLTLSDYAEVTYFVSDAYAPGAEGGARYNDPQFGIRWPGEVAVINDRDKNWPDYKD